jgi:GNAT superfamily N-acetyltransferase
MTDPVIEVSTDRSRLDLGFIHTFLVATHWAKDIPVAILARAIDHSVPFGLYKNGRQIGFARVVTDHATFAYLADVFVTPGERGKGYGRKLVDAALAHPELQGMRRWLLGTRDAAGLYKQLGFNEPPAGYFLEKKDENVYTPACAA